MTFLIVLCLTAIILLAIVAYGLQRRRRHRTLVGVRAWQRWETMLGIEDIHRRILEAENIVDRALQELGYTGSFGEKLRSFQKTLPNIDAVWHAHKLRNHIAHEPGIHISEGEAETAIRVFERVLRHFLPPSTPHT